MGERFNRELMDSPNWAPARLATGRPRSNPALKYTRPDAATAVMEKPEASLAEHEYLCPKCHKPHRRTSKIGKRHLKHLDG